MIQRRRARGLAMVLAGICVLLAPSARLYALTAALPPSSTSAHTSITAAPELARVYDAILDARFDAIPAMLRQTCPPAPEPACTLLRAVSLWWQIQLDPDDTSKDARFETDVDAAITAALQWTEREPNRAEAWFYVGGAYGARAQWRVLRQERLAAARDGKRIKTALERALALDPNLQDAYFGIGLYHYYADVAPTAAKMLRWLLALPGGDKVEGLQEMLRARRGGQLLRSEADYQLHLIYLWYEHRTDRALELLQDLRTRHPRNPLFPQLIAEIQDVYLHDHTASLRTWTDLLDAATQGRVAEPRLAEARAHLGMARELGALSETERAIPHLRAVIADAPPAPIGAVADAQLQLGGALGRLGHRANAIAAYRAAIAAAPESDRRTRSTAQRAIDRLTK